MDHNKLWGSTRDLMHLMAHGIPHTFASTFILFNDFLNELCKKNNDVLCIFTRGTAWEGTTNADGSWNAVKNILCALENLISRNWVKYNCNITFYNINEKICYKKEFGSARRERLELHI